MQVILLERVEKLGVMGDEVRVKDGFARNFLLPQGKALRATKENRARFERERSALEKLNAERRTSAQDVAQHLDGKAFVLIRQAGESGQLYGSVNSRDIVDAIGAESIQVTRGQVVLDSPIKAIGVHKIRIRLHAEVDSVVDVNVARTPEEADRQARGEDVIAAQAEEDRAIADAQAAELFEAGEERENEGVLVAGEGEDAAADATGADAEADADPS